MDMIKRVLKKKEGFTLVELIVVLVILAILAAILVPTLTGYINQANQEKNYSTAQTVRVAAQSVIDDQLGHKKLASNSTTLACTDTASDSNKTAAGQSVTSLAGVTTGTNGVSAYSFTFDKDTHSITSGTVIIAGSTYKLAIGDDGNNNWTVK